MNPIAFRPRRLGHVNLWVEDLERSICFYEQVCGIEFVRRERDILIGFHSNGNTHHDVGLIETSKGFDRVGRDGRVQIPATRGTKVGLNHLGWEMENEAELVAAYYRAKALLPGPFRTVDHLISHSMYISDPDGNSHEFYADALNDWRQIYNLEREDEVSGAWNPETQPPSSEPHYNVDPPIRRVDSAPAHPNRLASATIATSHFDTMSKFFINTAGLALLSEKRIGARSALFAGTTHRTSLQLQEVPNGERTGLRRFSFSLLEDFDLLNLQECCRQFNLHPPRPFEDDCAKGVLLTDPDGFEMELVLSASVRQEPSQLNA